MAFSEFFVIFVRILSVAFIGTDKWNRLADYQKSLFLCRLMSNYAKLYKATIESVFFLPFLITSKYPHTPYGVFTHIETRGLAGLCKKSFSLAQPFSY